MNPSAGGRHTSRTQDSDKAQQIEGSLEVRQSADRSSCLALWQGELVHTVGTLGRWDKIKTGNLRVRVTPTHVAGVLRSSWI
jgi:hypothetical protein